jgi:hypothetical protein
MKKFLFRALAYVAMTVGVIVGMLGLLPKVSTLYVSGYTPKCRLLENTSQPRMIFVGSSVLPYGLDSRRIQDSLHVNVVNTGLSGGLGLRYMIDDAEQYLQEGDILCLAFDYFQFYGAADGEGSGDLTDVVVQTGYKTLKLLNCAQWLNFIGGIPTELRARLAELRGKDAADKRAFNEFGDEITHWEEGYRPSPKLPYTYRPFDAGFCDYFIQWVERIQRRNVKVYILPPPFVETGLPSTRERIEGTTAFLKKSGHPFLMAPEMVFMSEDCAMGGFSHVTKKGVDIYTGKVIEALRPLL